MPDYCKHGVMLRADRDCECWRCETDLITTTILGSLDGSIVDVVSNDTTSDITLDVMLGGEQAGSTLTVSEARSLAAALTAHADRRDRAGASR